MCKVFWCTVLVWLIIFQVKSQNQVYHRQLVINEVMADPSTLFGLPNVEYVEIFNTSSATVPLQGLLLKDGNIFRPILSNASIAGNGFTVLVNNENDKNQLLAMFPDIQVVTLAGLGLTNGGEALVLSVSGGSAVDSYTFPPAVDGKSWEQINLLLTVSGVENWTLSGAAVGGTPGRVNQPITVTSSPAITFSGQNIAYRSLVINEIMADPSDLYGLPNVEYLEIFNTTQSPILSNGIVLKDGNTFRTLPQNTTIPALGYLVIVANQNIKNELLPFVINAEIVTLLGFGLTNGGESLALSVSGGNLIDAYTFAAATDGKAWEQINPFSPCSDKSNWKISIAESGGSPGGENSVFSQIRTKPMIKNIIPKSESQLVLLLNQNIDSVSFSASKIIIQSVSGISIGINQDSVFITNPQPFVLGQTYYFTVSGIKNCFGNSLDTTFSFGIGRQAQLGEIAINEIFADEDPVVGLPEAEYIEIVNTTHAWLDISGNYVFDSSPTSKGTIIKNSVLPPQGFMILCSASNAEKFKKFGVVAILNNFPSLNAAGDHIKIANINTVTIDEIKYTDKWYRDENKKQGGYALERINPYISCGGKYNWNASVSTIGGTPGSANSVFSTDNQHIKPQIIDYNLLDRQTLQLVFNQGTSESVDEKSIQITDRAITKIIRSKTNNDTLWVSINLPLDSGKIYSFSAQNIKDCYGNTSDYQVFNIGIGKTPQEGEIVINEIMADESPTLGLPEAEFIEIYNRTDYLIDLGSAFLYDATTVPGKFPSKALVSPKSYVILCSSSHINSFKPYGNVLGLSSFPSLANAGEKIEIKTKNGDLIDKVTYSQAWYRDEVKKDGGWSLEKIDPNNLCSGSTNWLAADNAKGGTPGAQNSVFATNPDAKVPAISSVFAFSKDTILIEFDEIIDLGASPNAQFLLNNELTLSLLEANENQVALKPNFSLESQKNYTITTKSIADCAGNILESQAKDFQLIQKADSFDIVINEVLFNPRTGGSDFVEIYNRSEKHIDLSHLLLANTENDTVKNAKEISTNHLIIKPKEYKVLTNNFTNIKNNYPKSVDSSFVPLENMPSYNDDKGTVVLCDKKNQIIDYFSYSDDFHLPLIDKTEGISLERINANLPTQTKENWASASANAGYATPGFLNSQSTDFTLSDKNIEIVPKIFSPDQDGYVDFTTIHFNINQPDYVANVTIYDIEGRTVRKLVRNQNIGIQNFFQWDGLDDAQRKAQVGNYMVYIEIFNTKGEVKQYKENVVVAARF